MAPPATCTCNMAPGDAPGGTITSTKAPEPTTAK
eukprot:CAMPEP_0173375728 /NCGR_PEP_ID=MMETSP1144-20121109/29792_1 /TAXON_ID=483371 /ORGANISM="non described non described, Strain CCMP2298" /LENGTH=33 /DNA_ID= /DNA_START= /DNA_END= /DNA_ORIENTATION=